MCGILPKEVPVPLRFPKTLRFRLIVTTVLCTALVSLVGNLSLYNYLNGIINQRAARIDEIYLSNLQTQLNEYLTDLSDLAVLCSSDTEVSYSLSPSASRLDALDAQERLDTYLATSSIQNRRDQCGECPGADRVRHRPDSGRAGRL